MEIILDRWIKPHFDISSWEFYNLSCESEGDMKAATSGAATRGDTRRRPRRVPVACPSRARGARHDQKAFCASCAPSVENN